MSTWEETLAELRRDFVRGSLERVERMGELLLRLERAPTAEDARTLMVQFHGLAGAGTTYGFPEVTRLGLDGERRLKGRLDAAELPDAGDRAALAALVADLRFAFSPHGAAKAAETPADAAPAPRLEVLVVEPDAAARDALAARLATEGYAVRTAATRAEAEAALAQRRPDAVIASAEADGSGHELVHVVRAQPGGDDVQVVLTSARSAFPDKVEAIASGADALLERPLDIQVVLERLQLLLDRQREAPGRILCVEDFKEQAVFLRTVLEAAGYEVRVCGEPRAFEDQLHGFQPDLILMDILLPGVSGYDLTRYVRQNPAHASVPVVFLTTEGQTEARIRGLRAGGDDYLTKPVTPALLLTTVAARLERARMLKSLMERDGLTRLLTHSAFLERAKQAFGRAERRPDSRPVLVMMDLDRFKAINDVHGHATGDRVLAAFGAFLRRRVRQVDVAGRYGGEEFALLLDSLSQADAVRLVDRLLDEFRSRAHDAPGGERFSVTFSAGVAGLDPERMGFEAWFKAADDALYEAKRLGRNRVLAAIGGGTAMGERIEFPSDGKTASGYLARPASGSGKGVLVIQEWWGLNDHVKAVADRFAREGFFALAPDLYHGTVTKSPDEAGKLLMALNIEQAGRDMGGAIARLKELSGGAVGTVGFCMGGALSLYAACRSGADVAACVVYYGGHPKVSYGYDGLRAPVLGHWAEDDDFANASRAAIEPELKQRGREFEFHTYPGTKHAFFNDTRPEVYDRAAAELSFERTLAFFRRLL